MGQYKCTHTHSLQYTTCVVQPDHLDTAPTNRKLETMAAPTTMTSFLVLLALVVVAAGEERL
jgi:hypothetical protein